MRIDRIHANRMLAFAGFTLCFLFLFAIIVLAFVRAPASHETRNPASPQTSTQHK